LSDLFYTLAYITLMVFA